MDARTSRQIEDEAAAWLARRGGSSWTDRDTAEFDAWLAAATAHRVAFVRLESGWAGCARLKALGAGIPRGTIPARGQWAAPTPPDRAVRTAVPRTARAARLAGVLAVLAIGTAIGLGWRAWFAVEAASYATAAGEMRTIALADGSFATLGPGSVIDVRFTRRDRGVALARGEAFFTVAHDTRRPFTVAVGARRAVAVGTQFAVRRDPDEMRIVVTEGVVRLELQSAHRDAAAPSTLLTAGAVATARANSVFVRAGSVAEAERALSWRNGYLSFHDTPLAAAVAEFNRYGARPLVVGDAAVGQIRIGGNFRWSNSDAFVRLLEEGFDVRVDRQADRIVLHSR
ncbi:MAG: hypothetical protein CMLOHMNK_00851 [Steroidobacteraceae bacterium]|nr:hypothetical protein [Steroidobacteraceae bacterium]